MTRTRSPTPAPERGRCRRRVAWRVVASPLGCHGGAGAAACWWSRIGHLARCETRRFSTTSARKHQADPFAASRARSAARWVSRRSRSPEMACSTKPMIVGVDRARTSRRAEPAPPRGPSTKCTRFPGAARRAIERTGRRGAAPMSDRPSSSRGWIHWSGTPVHARVAVGGDDPSRHAREVHRAQRPFS